MASKLQHVEDATAHRDVSECESGEVLASQHQVLQEEGAKPNVKRRREREKACQQTVDGQVCGLNRAVAGVAVHFGENSDREWDPR